MGELGKRHVLACALAVGLILSGCAGSTSERSASASTGSLTIERSVVGRPIPAGFLGLSTEFTELDAYTGPNPHAPNPIFQQLLRNLAAGQAPVFRIGGDSTDWSWWPVAHMREPRGIRYTLTPRLLAVARTLAQDLGAKLILGVNLEANSPRIAAAEARAFRDHIGENSIESLEIGNEPELYGSLAWFVKNGHKYYGRPSSYNISDYLREFTRFAHALPPGRLGGPNSGGPAWLKYFRKILRSEPRIRVASMHRYPLKKCSSSAVVTIPQLLGPGASRGYAHFVGGYARIAHAAHLPMRLDEMNAVSCGGAPGVSNTFAAALWGVDAMFEMARAGVDGVNVHTRPGLSGELFSFRRVHGAWQALIHPEYYGLMMFAQAAPPGSRLLRVAGSSRAKLEVWATRAPDGRVRVVLINKDLHQGRRLSLRIDAGTGPATLERLQARGASATSHVSLGGQHFGWHTGTLTGRPSRETLRPAAGRYSLRVPAASAAMLTLAP